MSYAERIETTVNNLDLEKPIFKLSISQTRIGLEEERWAPDLDESNVVNGYINRYARRRYDSSGRKYTVDPTYVIGAFEGDLSANLVGVFMACSVHKEPRRTNIYKSFCEVLRNNIHNQEFKNSLFNIYEYYWNNIQSVKISHPDNSVHRTNIYNLLCLMEKSYGNKRT